MPGGVAVAEHPIDLVAGHFEAGDWIAGVAGSAGSSARGRPRRRRHSESGQKMDPDAPVRSASGSFMAGGSGGLGRAASWPVLF
jgi:hypothetical protein